MNAMMPLGVRLLVDSDSSPNLAPLQCIP